MFCISVTVFSQVGLVGQGIGSAVCKVVHGAVYIRSAPMYLYSVDWRSCEPMSVSWGYRLKQQGSMHCCPSHHNELSRLRIRNILARHGTSRLSPDGLRFHRTGRYMHVASVPRQPAPNLSRDRGCIYHMPSKSLLDRCPFLDPIFLLPLRPMVDGYRTLCVLFLS